LAKAGLHGDGGNFLPIPCGGLLKIANLVRKFWAQSSLRRNSLDSLRLLIGGNHRILGRILKICGLKQKHSLPNSLPQGIGSVGRSLAIWFSLTDADTNTASGGAVS